MNMQNSQKTKFKCLGLGMLLALLLAGCGPSAAPAAALNASEADLAAIRQTALDYIDGWYTADADRMERSLYEDPALQRAGSSAIDTFACFENSFVKGITAR